ncbi:MAG: alpha/beta hydrolase [Pseudomonadales bacterium]|nr:alpha/beta hydrolase [Pseudomonadales bacterium]
MLEKDIYPDPPTTQQLLKELPYAAKEFFQLAKPSWRKQLDAVPAGDGHPIMTLPGFGGGDGSMAILRRFLNKSGYQAHPWELGTNFTKERVTTMDSVLEFCQKKESEIVDRLKTITDKTGEKVSLIGWSLGGVYANSVAQTHPELVRQIITLGSPIGDPRGTSTWDILKKLNRSDVPEEDQNVGAWLDRKEGLGERKVRTSILYSLRDGAVSRGSAVIENHPLVDNIEVSSSHVGFAHNPLVYYVIADRLSQDLLDWDAFDVTKQPQLIQKHL